MVVCVMVLLFSLFLWFSLSFPLSSPYIVLPGWRWPGVAGCHPLGCSRLYPLLVDILRFSIAVCVCPSFSLNGLCNSGPAYVGCWSPLFLSSFAISVIFCTRTNLCTFTIRKTIQFSKFSVSRLFFLFFLLQSELFGLDCVWTGSRWALVIRYSPWHSVTSSLAWPRRWSSFGWGEIWSSCPFTDTSPTLSYSLSSVSTCVPLLHYCAKCLWQDYSTALKLLVINVCILNYDWSVSNIWVTWFINGKWAVIGDIQSPSLFLAIFRFTTFQTIILLKTWWYLMINYHSKVWGQ